MLSLLTMPASLGNLSRKIFAQQLRNLDEFLRLVESCIDAPLPRSPAANDLKLIESQSATDELRGLRWWAVGRCQRGVVAARSHAEGLRTIVETDKPESLLPALSVARSVHEAVLRICWLVDPSVDPSSRLTRWAGDLLHSTQEPIRTQNLFGDVVSDDARKQALDARQLGQRLMREAGFELVPKKGDRSDDTANLAYDGVVSTLQPKLTDLVDQHLPQHPYLWALLSGAAHSYDWFLLSERPGPVESVGAIVLPLLDTADAFTCAMGDYFGLSPRTIVTKTHLHRHALFRIIQPWYQGPAQHVDDYRVANGLAPIVTYDSVDYRR